MVSVQHIHLSYSLGALGKGLPGCLAAARDKKTPPSPSSSTSEILGSVVLLQSLLLSTVPTA